MIVKVQLSLNTSEATRQVLIYNKSRSILFEGLADSEVINAMNGEPKRFFQAHLDFNERVVLDDVVDDRDW
jgi:hypothetical protein